MFEGFVKLFSSKKATITLIIGVAISGMATQGFITTELAAQLLALVGGSYVVGQGAADFGTGGSGGKPKT